MTFQSKSEPYDVIIAGAGPVGLFLACELALARCSVLVLERAQEALSPLKLRPFGIRGLSGPTVEAFYHRDLLRELQLHKTFKNPHKTASPGPGPQRQGGHFAGLPFLDGNVDAARWEYRLPGSPATSLLSEMAEIETVLARRAESLGVEIRRGVVITDYQQTADGVAVQAAEQTFAGKYLVGCDGSRSVVRKLGGFEFAGTEPEFTGYSAQVDLANPEKLSPGRNLTATGMYFQSQPGYLVMLEFDGGAGHQAEPLTLAQVQATLRRVSNTDVTITALRAATTWTDRSRQATTYRNGRVLLVGDAAHIHSPLGGQGLNLGIGDAMNLGWKLAATIRQLAPETLLDSYETERHPIAAQVLDWSRAQVAIMRPDAAARALRAVVGDLMETRDGATYFAARVWGVNTQYDLGGDHPLIGRSVPDFEFEDGSRLGESMHSGHSILLDFAGDASLKCLADEYGERLRYVRGQAKEQFGLSALLIRPDGIIAWAAAAQPNIGELQQVAARFLLKESA